MHLLLLSLLFKYNWYNLWYSIYLFLEPKKVLKTKSIEILILLNKALRHFSSFNTVDNS